MGKYLKKFENHAAYEAAESSLILPNVSLCVQENDVHYNPSTPPTPQHDYVEIGGIKWATKNVGANSVTDYGLYFQWGDVSGYTATQVGTDKQFISSDYKYYGDGGSTIIKYNETDGLTSLTSSDDAVVANLGGNWRMPTTDDFQELGYAVNSVWTSDYQGSGVSGLVCTDKTDSSKTLFFPAAGYSYNGGIPYVGKYGCYWSSTLRTNNISQAKYMLLGSSVVRWDEYFDRYNGFTIRGILDE